MYVRQAGVLIEDSSYCISREDSKTYVIGYLKSGKMYFQHNGQVYHFNQGESIILPEKIKYKLYADTINLPCFEWLNIRGDLMSCMYNHLFESVYTVAKVDITNYLEKIHTEIANILPDDKKITKILIDIIMVIYENNNIMDGDRFVYESNLKLQFDHYISNIIQNEQILLVEEMANKFLISISQLNRLFKSYYKCTPYNYYQKMRIDIAKSLLENSQLSINDISTRLLYNDRNYFSKYFFQKVGKYPAEYRKSMNNKKVR